MARHGDDYTAIHIRWGGTSLHHERHNGWDTGQTANRLMELARHWRDEAAKYFRSPTGLVKIKIKIDDTGVGGGVTDFIRQANSHSIPEQQYNAIPIAAGGRPNNPEGYRNLRSELWFDMAERSFRGLVDFSRLPADVLKLLRAQFMAPIWKPLGVWRDVEPKDMTKKRLPGLGSPDDADATNLAYYSSVAIGTGVDSVDTSERDAHHYGRR